MVLLDPIHGVGDQEVFHFVFPVIENFRSPVGMLSFSGIRVFVERLAVKVRKAVGVPREMGGNPVQDHADALFVQIIDEIHELLGRSVAGGGRIIAGYLVAPGGVQRMLGDPH